MKNIKINKYLFAHIIITIISIITAWSLSIDQLAVNLEKNLFFLGWIINLLFIWNIYSIYKVKRNILDFSIVFQSFIFLFCNGQIFLYTLGIDIKQLSVLKISTDIEIVREVVYFYFSLLFFQIGSMICIKSDDDELYEVNIEKYNSAIKIIAYIFLAMSIFPYFYILIPKLILSIRTGYSSLYESAVTVSGIIGYASKYFIPSIIMLLFTYKNDKKPRNAIMAFLTLIAAINLIIGARGDSLSIVVILLVFYNTFIKQFKGIKLFKLFIFILLIMIVIPVISTFRSVSNKSITSLVEGVKETLSNDESNFIVRTISELGYTMHSFILTDQVVPEIDEHKNGESYIASVMMLIPSQLMGGYSFANKAALDVWLQDIHNMSYGPGFSIVAETYYNFGYYGGILFTAILGYIFTKMFNIKSKDKNKNELLKLLSLIFLYNSLIIARFPFHNTVRNIVYMYVVPYLAIIIIHNTRYKERGITK